MPGVVPGIEPVASSFLSLLDFFNKDSDMSKRSDFIVPKPKRCGKCGNPVMVEEAHPFMRRVESWKCVLCGYRVWSDFAVRQPTKHEKDSLMPGNVKGYRSFP